MFKIWFWGLFALVLAIGALIVTPIVRFVTPRSDGQAERLGKTPYLLFMISGSVIAALWLVTFVVWRFLRVYRLRYLAERDVQVSPARFFSSLRSQSFDSHDQTWRKRPLGTRKLWFSLAISWTVLDVVWLGGLIIPAYIIGNNHNKKGTQEYKQMTWQIPVMTLSAAFVLLTPVFWLPYLLIKRRDGCHSHNRWPAADQTPPAPLLVNERIHPDRGAVYVNGTPLADVAQHVIDGHLARNLGLDGTIDGSPQADQLANRLSSIEEHGQYPLERFPSLCETHAPSSCPKDVQHLAFAAGTAPPKLSEDANRPRSRGRSVEVHSHDGVPNIEELNPNGNLVPLTRMIRHVSFDLTTRPNIDCDKKTSRYMTKKQSGACASESSGSNTSVTEAARSTDASSGSIPNTKDILTENVANSQEWLRRSCYANAGLPGNERTAKTGKGLSRWLRGHSYFSSDSSGNSGSTGSTGVVFSVVAENGSDWDPEQGLEAPVVGQVYSRT